MERVAEILQKRRNTALEKANEKTSYLHSLSPEIVSIDKELNAVPYKLYSLGASKENLNEVILKTNELRKKRNEIIKSLGLSENYDEPEFICKKCNDTGYIKLEKCSCLKHLEAETVLTAKGLGKGLANCTFQNFDKKYFTDSSMIKTTEKCLKYAENFTMESGNLLLYGGTGLGKTHLAAAIAHKVSEKGITAVYESANKIVSDIKKSLFSGDSDIADVYFDENLLIIDDLGTEVRTEYSVSAISELINRRIVMDYPTVISTNYELQAIEKDYGERIFSRILGSFSLVHFVGLDVRKQKLSQN